MTAKSENLPDQSGTLVAFCATPSDVFEAAVARAESMSARIVVVAPIPSLMATRLTRLSVAKLLPVLPGLQNGQSEVISYSLPGFFSLGDPSASLRHLMPGLKEMGRTIVDRCEVDQLASALSDLPRPFRIVVDLPGAEAEILRSLEAAGILAMTDEVKLRCGIEAFFVGSEPADVIAKWLGKHDFMLFAQDNADPDWPVVDFRADAVGKENRNLRLQLSELTADRDAARLVAAGAQDKVVQIQATLAEQEEELGRIRLALDHERAALSAERQARAAADEQRVAIEVEKDKQGAALRQAYDAYEGERAALATARAQLDTTSARMVSLEAELLQCQEQLSVSEQALATVRSDLAVSLRLQAMAQADLRDLQGRFSEVERQRNQQADLLRKLAPRLLLAADQLTQMMNLPAPQSAGLPIVHALSGKKGKPKKGKRR